MKKKGQFYLIAAIIIVIIITGLATLTNYITTKKEPVRVYDLGEELSEESFRTSEFVIVNDDADFNLKMQELSNNFSSYAKEGVSEIVVIYGNKDIATSITYQKEETGVITATIGENSFIISGEKGFKPKVTSLPAITAKSGNVKVTLLNKDYNFEIKEKENFFFIITKNQTGEIHIIKKEEIPSP